ncbi:MAG TPA: hypothetical protein VMT61_13620 [Candidatus Binataceae bacterium]|nr:hypothetical protein [Candidatus Binataceae bacterium]
MELRLLSSPEERRAFAHNLVETRLTKGAGFAETARSSIGEAHLAFGRLYGLYDDESDNPEDMLSGFVLHDLASFPQSYPKPDLTYLPPESVIECGELWAKAPGSARLIRQAAWILASQKVQAILLYPLLKPWNLSTFYNNGFERVGEPIEWPYIRTLEGQKMFVQAMVSEGQNLNQLVAEASQWGFEPVPT